MDLEKPGPRKTCNLKNLDPEKHKMKMELKNVSDFRQFNKECTCDLQI